MGDKKLLIVAYRYPPDKTVGSRRWTKLSRQLSKKGNKVFVITATPNDNNLFCTENIDGIVTYRIKSKYPAILKYFGKMNLCHKIKYALYKKYYFATRKGNIHDAAIGWNKQLITTISKLIKEENIKNIIITGPPYRHMYYISKIKHLYPDINLILDLRDPWTEIKTFRFLLNIKSNKRLADEINFEKEAVKQANYVVNVSEERTKLFDDFISDTKKCITITNGVEMDDYAFLSSETTGTSDSFSIAYIGSLYPETENPIRTLVTFINANKDALISAKVKFEFCGHISTRVANILERAPREIVTCHGTLPQQDAIRILNHASAGLIIFREGYENINFITKLYEYMALKKKIIYLGPPSDSLSAFLSSNNIGTSISLERIDDLLKWFLNKEKFNTLSYANLDMSPYLFENLAKQYEDLLI
jgi:glycosyltransferase involved in cell wall biosynthesis